MDSLNRYSFSVFVEDSLKHLFLFIIKIKILSSCMYCVINSDCCYWMSWVLLNMICSECSIDICTEFSILEFIIGILVCIEKRIKFSMSQIKVEHRHDTFKLGLGNSSFSKLIEVKEELFNSYSFHNNLMLQSLFNICRIVWNFNSFLHKSIINNI